MIEPLQLTSSARDLEWNHSVLVGLGTCSCFFSLSVWPSTVSSHSNVSPSFSLTKSLASGLRTDSSAERNWTNRWWICNIMSIFRCLESCSSHGSVFGSLIGVWGRALRSGHFATIPPHWIYMYNKLGLELMICLNPQFLCQNIIQGPVHCGIIILKK